MSLVMTFDEFTRHVHSKRTAGAGESLTDSLVSYLRIAKPALERAATAIHDPNVPPYPLTQWLEFVRNNWTAYDRPKTDT